MSSHDDLVVATELKKYIKAHGRKDDVNRCWKIDAATEGWGKFLETFPHFKDSGRKPKKFCESQSLLLCWISDDSAPGKGFIAVPFKQGMVPSTSVSVLNAKSVGCQLETVFRTMKDVTITSDHETKTTHLIGTTYPTTEIIEVERKVL